MPVCHSDAFENRFPQPVQIVPHSRNGRHSDRSRAQWRLRNMSVSGEARSANRSKWTTADMQPLATLGLGDRSSHADKLEVPSPQQS
jgi:hypothetical protein